MKRRLILGICLLLVSALLFGASTYAWFSMNTDVRATGMQIRAVAAASVVISNAEDGVYSDTAADPSGEVKTLKPSSTVNLTDWFYVKDPKDVTSYTDGSAIAGETVFEKVSTEPNDYYKKTDFFVKLQGQIDSGMVPYSVLYIKSVVPTGAAASAISNALRVGVKCGSNFFIYAPFADADTSQGGLKTTGIYGGASTAPQPITTSFDDSSNLIAGMGALSATPVTVSVYVWYEGQDASCTSANSVDVENLSVAIEFAARTANA